MRFSRRTSLALPLFLALAATAASARPLSASSSSSSSRRLLADNAPQFHSGAGPDVFAQPMPSPFSFQQVATSDRAMRRAQRKGLAPPAAPVQPQQPATFVDARNPPLEAAGDEEEQVTAQGGAPPQLPPGVSVPPGGQRPGGNGNGAAATAPDAATLAAAAAANGGKLPEGASAAPGGVQYMPNGAIMKPLPAPRVVTFKETIKLPGVIVAIGLTGGALLLLVAGLGMMAHRAIVYRRADAIIAAAVTPRASASMTGGGGGSGGVLGGGVLSRLGSVRSSSVAGGGSGGSSGSEAGKKTAALLQGRGSVSTGDDEAFTSPMAAVPKAPATTSPW